MPYTGYTGISYPFRISNRGGVVMTTTNQNDVSHIIESIQQILNTDYLERPMEGDTVYSEVSTLLFDPNDESLQEVVKSQIIEDLERLEDRIECEEDGINFVVETEDDCEYLYIDITFNVVKYDT